MKQRSLFLILVCYALGMQAQKLTVEKMAVSPMDLTASTQQRNDLIGNPCALVKVQLPTEGVSFEGNVLGDVAFNSGEYWVYMSAGSYMLNVKHPNFHPLMVNFRDYDIRKVEGKTTYVLTIGILQNSQLEKKQKLIINYSPKSATVLVDAKLQQGKGRIEVELPVGEHSYVIAANGYSSAEGKVTLNAESPRTITESLVALKPEPKPEQPAQVTQQPITVVQQQPIAQTQQTPSKETATSSSGTLDKKPQGALKKSAVKEAKRLEKEGWRRAYGDKPLSDQLLVSMMKQSLYDANDYPKYVFGNGQSVGESYDEAKYEAVNMARQTLVVMIQEDMKNLIELSVNNKQLQMKDVASLNQSVNAAYDIILHDLERTETTVELYRELPDGKKEASIQVAYEMKAAKILAKEAMRKEMKQRGDSLADKLDELLDW